MLSGPIYMSPTAHQALILLHGYGANGNDLFALTPELTSFIPDLAVFAPNAPTPLFQDSYEWFNLNDFFEGNSVSEAYLKTLVQRALPSVQKVQDYICWIEEKYGISSNQITIAGFSQGGLVAAITALTAQQPFKGLALMSAVPLLPNIVEIKQKIPVLITHGAQDMVVPSIAANLSKSHFKTEGFSVIEYISPNLEHGIDAGCIQALVQFIKNN